MPMRKMLVLLLLDWFWMDVVSRLVWSRKASHDGGGVSADTSKNLDFHFVCYKSQYGLRVLYVLLLLDRLALQF